MEKYYHDLTSDLIHQALRVKQPLAITQLLQVEPRAQQLAHRLQQAKPWAQPELGLHLVCPPLALIALVAPAQFVAPIRQAQPLITIPVAHWAQPPAQATKPSQAQLATFVECSALSLRLLPLPGFPTQAPPLKPGCWHWRFGISTSHNRIICRV